MRKGAMPMRLGNGSLTGMGEAESGKPMTTGQSSSRTGSIDTGSSPRGGYKNIGYRRTSTVPGDVADESQKDVLVCVRRE